MRKLLFAGLLLGGGTFVGCGDDIPPAPVVEQKTVIPDLIKGLDSQSAFGRRFSARRLGELGDMAKEAIPALKAAAKKHPDIKKDCEESIAKIEGRVPAAPAK